MEDREEETCPVCGGEGRFYDEDAGWVPCDWCAPEPEELNLGTLQALVDEVVARAQDLQR